MQPSVSQLVLNCAPAHLIKSRAVHNCDVARERVNGITTESTKQFWGVGGGDRGGKYPRKEMGMLCSKGEPMGTN